MSDTEVPSLSPSCLTEFETTVEDIAQHDGLVASRHRLACRSCAGERFDLFEAQTREFGTVGIDATCLQCARSLPIFQAIRDGYDGRLGHLRHLEQVSAQRSDRPLCSNARLACEVSYSIDIQELAAIAAEEQVPVQDLFDWFMVWIEDGAAESWRCVWEYECA
jgi:hypothetical protein